MMSVRKERRFEIEINDFTVAPLLLYGRQATCDLFKCWNVRLVTTKQLRSIRSVKFMSAPKTDQSFPPYSDWSQDGWRGLDLREQSVSRRKQSINQEFKVCVRGWARLAVSRWFKSFQSLYWKHQLISVFSSLLGIDSQKCCFQKRQSALPNSVQCSAVCGSLCWQILQVKQTAVCPEAV